MIILGLISFLQFTEGMDFCPLFINQCEFSGNTTAQVNEIENMLLILINYDVIVKKKSCSFLSNYPYHIFTVYSVKPLLWCLSEP